MNLIFSELITEYGLTADSSKDEILAAIRLNKNDQDNDDIRYLFICACIDFLRKSENLSLEILNVIAASGAETADRIYGERIFGASEHGVKTCLGHGRSKTSALQNCLDKLLDLEVEIVSASLIKKRSLLGSWDCLLTYRYVELDRRSEIALLMTRSLLKSPVADKQLVMKYFALTDMDDPEILLKLSKMEDAGTADRDSLQFKVDGLSAVAKESCQGSEGLSCGVSKDSREELAGRALDIARKKAAEGDISSMGIYALMIMNRDPETAMRFAQGAAAENDARGQYVLAMLYKNKLAKSGEDVACEKPQTVVSDVAGGTPREVIPEAVTIAEIQELLAASSAQGYTDADYELGQLLVERSSSDAFNHFKNAADHGHKEACLNVGLAYLQGQGVKTDNDKAFYYLQEAADNGIHQAQYRLGEMYYQGLCGEVNPEKAFEYFEKASEGNIPEATYRKGLCMCTGSGTRKDAEKGMRLIKNAAKAGCQEATKKIAQLYFDDNENSEVRFNAFTYLKQLADEGLTNVQTMVGRAYIQGDCIQRDIRKAAIYLRKAADIDPVAASLLAGLNEEPLHENSNLDILQEMLTDIITPSVKWVVTSLTEDVPVWAYKCILQPDNELYRTSQDTYSGAAVLQYEELQLHLKNYFLTQLAENEPEALKGTYQIDPNDLEIAALCKLIRFRFFEGESRSLFLTDPEADCNEFLKLFSSVAFLRNELSHIDDNTYRKYSDSHNMRQLMDSLDIRCQSGAENAKKCLVKGSSIYVILNELRESLADYAEKCLINDSSK